MINSNPSETTIDFLNLNKTLTQSLEIQRQDLKKNKQLQTLNLSRSHNPSNKPIFYIIDGLKLSKEKCIDAEIKLNTNNIKRLSVKKRRNAIRSEAESNIKINSKILFILNNLELDRKNKKLLSQINEEDITLLRFLERECAINEYGKKGKHGALIIKTN